MKEKNKKILTVMIILIFIAFIYFSNVFNIDMPIITEMKDALIRIWLKW